jgi:hypothetical protein
MRGVKRVIFIDRPENFIEIFLCTKTAKYRMIVVLKPESIPNAVKELDTTKYAKICP